MVRAHDDRRRVVRGLATSLLTVLLTSTAAASDRAAPPAPPIYSDPCHAEVTLEPASAVVGEQVRYRVRILRRPEVLAVRWLRTPVFPSLRAEWIPGRTPDPRITGVGSGMLVFEERRALFPAAAGALEIPAAQIGCGLAGDTEFAADVPPASLWVDSLPAAGRPDDFSGVVGAVRVRSRVSAPLVALGESFALAVSVTGTANVWAAAAPLDPARDLPGVDAYPRAPELEFDRGELLSARRTFVWDFVPRNPGTLRIPPARVSYYNPDSQRYERAAGPPLAIEVIATAARGGAAPPDREAGSHGSGALDEPTGPWRAWGIWTLVVMLGAGALASLAARGHRRNAPLRAATTALETADVAAARGDRDATARALAAALRSALALRLAGAGSLAAEELAARAAAQGPAFEDAASLLLALDRARFAAPGAEPPLPSPETVRATVRALGATRSR